MFKHLLVPTDGSESSLAAVRRAVSFAKEAGARITFLHAEHEFPAVYLGEGAIIDESAPTRFHELADSQAHEILDEAKAIAREGDVVCTTLVMVCDSAYDAVIEAADKTGCDLIFMALHGRHGIGEMLLGSDTEKLLRRARVPVLIHR
ncbi:Nucleotide-binding universal stress protein, UspA family [Formivibrio citricus]|uniref:Nucleotide-binding universal stress protein, UspA family n=1 Tax=Formivibrio citricus TaxID=83765 RepID=A0A1I4UZ28_9NEIS|nr:universal stress protein [Formivibrio citricus]SFM94023.1 Nucleotide-binding universal stress protein, UspA family [Formivibrio citricus]